MGTIFEVILKKESVASFFFDNNLIDFSCFNGDNLYYILARSPISEKIWDSGVLKPYLNKLTYNHILRLLGYSPIQEKIKKSLKLM